MSTRTLHLSVAGLVSGFALSAACNLHVKNEGHCYYHEGNATCEERWADEGLVFCGTKCLARDGNPASPHRDGCVSAAPEEGCYSPCGGEKDVSEDMSCLGEADTGTSGPTSATEPTGTSVTMTDATTVETSESVTLTTTMTSDTEPTTSGPTGCVESSECSDPELPLCIDEVCSPCQDAKVPDAACAAKDAELGVCGESGACVECSGSNSDACDGTTPVCDEETSACVGCGAHEQCGMFACAFETGECLDACRYEVDGDGGKTTTTIQAAVNMVDDGADCTIVVHDYEGDTYGTVVIDGGKRIALLAASGVAPRITGNSGAGVEVSGGAVLYARGLDIRGNTSDVGLSVAGAGTLAYVDDTLVVLNTGGGITVGSSAELRLRNSIVGGANSSGPGLRVTSASVGAVYTTIVGIGVNGQAVVCSAPLGVDVRNALIFAEDDADEFACMGGAVTVAYTAAEADLAGTGNEGVALQTSSFANFGEANFLLSPAGGNLVEDIARWQDGDPATDIEGDARPNVDGMMDFAGADVP